MGERDGRDRFVDPLDDEHAVAVVPVVDRPVPERESGPAVLVGQLRVAFDLVLAVGGPAVARVPAPDAELPVQLALGPRDGVVAPDRLAAFVQGVAGPVDGSEVQDSDGCALPWPWRTR